MNTTTAEETMTITEVKELVEAIGQELALEIGAEIIAEDEAAALESFMNIRKVEFKGESLGKFLAERWDTGEFFIFLNDAAGKLLEQEMNRETTRNGEQLFSRAEDWGDYLSAHMITGGGSVPVIYMFAGEELFPLAYSAHVLGADKGLTLGAWGEAEQIALGAKGMQVVL